MRRTSSIFDLGKKNKPRYLPNKEEFLRYLDTGYLNPEKPYSDFTEFVLNNRLCPNGGGIDGVDGDLIDLREMIQHGASFNDVMDYFNHRRYNLSGLSITNQFIQLVIDIINNTRLYENNGHTPSELAPKRTTNSPVKSPRIGRNDPCPCGSGLKYKKCHGL